jgi:predicted dinucleotide-binding enzyme
MKLAIIGCGYIGSAVARLWHAAGNEVTVTTTRGERVEELQAIASQVVVLMGDDLSGLKQVVADQDVVLLSIGSKQRTPEVYRQTYLATAQNLVTAIKANSGVGQLIYTCLLYTSDAADEEL